MAFISEIHYANSVANSTGVSEFVEVTLSPDEYANASDYELTTYQADGSVAATVNLGTLTPVLDPDTGYYVYQFSTPVTSPDHILSGGEAEAVALTDVSTGGDGVISFYDIGGGTQDITATEGPAAGTTSSNIPGISGGTQSIQFDIYGNRVDGPLDQGSSIICFAAGTRIETAIGPRAVERLTPGDLILTKDNGLQELRQVHMRRLSAAELRATPQFRPILLPRDCLAPGQPARDLRVSPQHRMLLDDPRFELYFDAPEVLAPAKALVGRVPGVAITDGAAPVTYVHLVFDAHEIVFAEGAPSESFHPGTEAMAALPPAARAEFNALFPEFLARGSRDEAPYLSVRGWELAAALG